MLVYFDPAAMCDQMGLLIAPLPAKKQLWEASNELVWKAETRRVPSGIQKTFGLAANGDLVRMDEDRLSATALQSESFDAGSSERGGSNWEEWCAGMDGFGGLVMLAASLAA